MKAGLITMCAQRCRMWGKIAWVLTSLCAGLWLQVGCSSQAGRQGEDVLIFARGSDAQKLDPADVDDGESVNVLAQVCEGLVRFADGSLEIEPWLATEYTISNDGLEYTFYLREGVYFHDGAELTAEAAVFSFLRQMVPDHPGHLATADYQYWRALYGDIAAVEVDDKYVLRFVLKQPNAALLHSLAIFPAWLISPQVDPQQPQQMQQHPVGTGPYRFVSWVSGETIVLERNPDYWGEMPEFERIVFKVTPENTVRVLELQQGVVHGADGLQPAEVFVLEQSGNYSVYRGGDMNLGYLAFNLEDPQFDDVRLRQAIAHAIDTEALVDIGLDGAGSVAEFPLPPGFEGRPEGERFYQYDPERARELLAGRTFERPLQLNTFSAPRIYFPDPVRIASLIRQDLEKVGIPVEVVVRDFNSHLTLLRSGQYEMGLLGWIGDNGDPDNFLGVLLSSAGAVRGSATNVSFYRNPAFDAKLDQARQRTDTEGRERLYAEAVRLWGADLPMIPLVHAEQLIVWRKEYTGFVAQPTGELRLYNVRKKQ